MDRRLVWSLLAGAADARPGTLEIDPEWVCETAPELVPGKLGPGIAVANLEDPNAMPTAEEGQDYGRALGRLREAVHRR